MFFIAFFLFNDLLVYAKINRVSLGGKYLSLVRRIPIDPDDGFKLTPVEKYEGGWQFTVMSSQDSFVVLFPTNEGKTEEKDAEGWHQDINSCIEDQTLRMQTLTIHQPSGFSVETKGPSPSKSDLNSRDNKNVEEKDRDQEMQRVAPVWKPNSSRRDCVCCAQPFGVWRRKHHCRMCGDLVCAACSRHRLNLNNSPSQAWASREKSNFRKTDYASLEDSSRNGTKSVPQRVCDVCMRKGKKAAANTQTPQTPLLSDNDSSSCYHCSVM